MNTPVTPSNMNSQSTTAAVNNLQSPIVHTTVLNSNINVGRQQQQQYQRPLLKTVDENITKGTGNSSDRTPFTETLPFENYRTIDSTTRNNNYTGANRSLDNDEDGHDGDVDEVDDEDHHKQFKRKSNEQNLSQSSRPSNMIGDSFSRNIPPSIFLDTSVRSSPNHSTILMMMKGNGGTEDKNLGGNKKQITSSSSSSSLLVDEHQKFKSRRYNFVPTSFSGVRSIAKSTEQLNRSFASDSLVNYPPPTSILKPTSTPSAILSSSSKTNACQ